MEWVKERIFECEYQEMGRTVKKRMICRHRDDGVMFYLVVNFGHPFHDTRENIVHTFANYALQVVDVGPCTEEEFDASFAKNIRERKGVEITDGKFYTYLKPDKEKIDAWREQEYRNISWQYVGEGKKYDLG